MEVKSYNDGVAYIKFDQTIKSNKILFMELNTYLTDNINLKVRISMIKDGLLIVDKSSETYLYRTRHYLAPLLSNNSIRS